MAFVIVFALLLGTAGACVAFSLQITTLKSEIGHQNTSIGMLYQQLNQQNQQLRQEFNSPVSCKDLL